MGRGMDNAMQQHAANRAETACKQRGNRSVANCQAAADVIRARLWVNERVSWVEAAEACGLTPREQRTCEMIAEGHSMAEAGAVLGVTKQAVSQLAERARKKLRLAGPLHQLIAPLFVPEPIDADAGELLAELRPISEGDGAARQRARAPFTRQEHEWRRLERQADRLLARC